MMEESLVLDLAVVNPTVMTRLIQSAQGLALRDNWYSSDEALVEGGGFSHHMNHSPPVIRGRRIQPAPGSWNERVAVTPSIRRGKGYRDWGNAWGVLVELLERPELELVRVYLNAYPFGADAGAHRDSEAEDELTAIVSVVPRWDRDWGGETVLYDERGEVVRSVLPNPGRVFIFRSRCLHAARPLARGCRLLRKVVVFKFAPWPANEPIVAKVPDALAATASVAVPEWQASGDALDDGARVAAAIQWLGQSRAARMPHGKGTLATHLITTAAWLQAWGVPSPTVLGGLCHAVFGTQVYPRRFLDPLAHRAMADRVFTPKGAQLGVAYASCDRLRLQALSEVVAGAGTISFPVELVRHARGVEGPRMGKLMVDADELEALWWIDAANRASQMTDPGEIHAGIQSLREEVRSRSTGEGE